MKKSRNNILLAVGCLISIFFVCCLQRIFFSKDLEAFWKWAQVWGNGWQNIYVACPECNYPILGMFSSAGLISFLRGLGYDKAVFSYRLFLGLIDGLNVILVFWILKRLDVEKPAYLAGIIGISISSWAGGALWGQIDSISQLFILMSLFLVVYKNTEAKIRIEYYWLYLSGSAILMACVILTKQLTIFSAFSLGILLITDIAFHCRNWTPFAKNFILTLSVFCVSLFVMDIFLHLKPPYFSHLIYIWQEGFYQGGLISGNGFNIWMFLGRDMWSSAHVPIFENIPFTNPYNLGIVLFSGLLALSSLSLILALHTRYQQGETVLNREVLLNFIFHLALINLSFNVCLTGTRERYLFHFYPFAILAWSGLRVYNQLFSEKILSILIIGSSLYGIFILQILSTLDLSLGTSTHIILAVFHAILLVYVIVIFLRYQRFDQNMLIFYRRMKNCLPTVR